MHVGGEGEPTAMSVLLGAFAACDIEVVSTHAALLGIQLESLSIEARGHFNVQALFAINGAPSPGYDQISYTIKIHAPAATPEQLAYLRERCERSSPVGDSLGRPIPLNLEFVTEP
ncbi:MAG: OsmC family protein [bacterium]